MLKLKVINTFNSARIKTNLSNYHLKRIYTEYSLVDSRIIQPNSIYSGTIYQGDYQSYLFEGEYRVTLNKELASIPYDLRSKSNSIQRINELEQSEIIVGLRSGVRSRRRVYTYQTEDILYNLPFAYLDKASWGSGVILPMESMLHIYTDLNLECPILILGLIDQNKNRFRFLAHILGEDVEYQITTILCKILSRGMQIQQAIVSTINYQPELKSIALIQENSNSRVISIFRSMCSFPQTLISQKGWIIKMLKEAKTNYYTGSF